MLVVYRLGHSCQVTQAHRHEDDRDTMSRKLACLCRISNQECELECASVLNVMYHSSAHAATKISKHAVAGKQN